MSTFPIVFAGPSGVGKGTIIKHLMEKYPTTFGFSVSHTTRAPRENEVDGVHYNFVSKEEMEAAIERNEFIEYARVHTNVYGTSYDAINKVIQAGKICILDIDIQGVQNVKNSSLFCKYIFIVPPSIEELETRLRGRGTETEEKISIRMQNALIEMDYGLKEGNFDVIIKNDTIEGAVQRIEECLKFWFENFP